MAPIRKKSQGSIRSPHVKRNIQSDVSHEGWIYKLEGGALKQWKHRWCVLVDFCLFFYKAPHEKKVTSSILLPSYKINPCLNHDKISKKFAFKVEHQNMKTYYFAAEDKESMRQWMNVMSLATIMQKPVVDDDESGFTSYRSCRNRSSSTPRAVSSLKQRSSSCGDRVNEMFLGSDDKYPTSPQLYANSRTPQQKQPLYANAPPKPRRLTQTAIVYPGDLDTVPFNSNRYENEECYPQNAIIYPGDMTAVQYNQSNEEYYRQYLSDDSSNMHCTTMTPPATTDFYRVQPPRPRSADFLERENECTQSQYTSQCYENRQPQRPKSSLECYNSAAVDPAEYDDYDYREAVRIQADNFYSSKNIMKIRNYCGSLKQTGNITKSDSRLNIDSGSLYTPVLRTNKGSYSKDEASKSGCNESMQRLLEWKQRMLQSPLSRRNQLHSEGSNCKQTSYSSQDDSLRRCKTYRHNYSGSSLNENLPSSNCTVSSVRPDILNDSHEHSYTSCDKIDQMNRSSKDSFEGEDTIKKNYGQSSVLSDAADNLYQKNIMYCVDSENNEILFSYDSSPTNPSAPATFHSKCHYPPQMHSFSTLSNVNSAGIEPLATQCASYTSEFTTEKHSSREQLYSHQSKPDLHSAEVEKGTTYTSDDEDEVIEDSYLKLPPKETVEELKTEEKYYPDRSSPDYVNIGSVCATAVEMCSSNSVQQSPVSISRATLKQLKPVSEYKSFFDSSDVTARTKETVNDVECDIKREDYYRASQMFYSSMRMKNRFCSQSNKKKSEMILQASAQDKLKSEKIRNLDQDIGLPIVSSRLKPSNKIASDICHDIIESTSKDSVCTKPLKSDVAKVDCTELKQEKYLLPVETRKHMSYEEMRGQLLRQREAPPPNIVQERIKKFEKAKSSEDCKKLHLLSHSKISKNDLHSSKYGNRSFSKRNRQKNSRLRAQKRTLHSDSEALALGDSDVSSDDLTMKSAPILLSPLSSVLVDLRKTADTGKDNNNQCTTVNQKDSLSNPGDVLDDTAVSPSFKLLENSLQTVEDAVYLPMYGIKALHEPEYVTMSGCKSSSSDAAVLSKHKGRDYGEEHVYNEPFSPPASFLHDVYEKQRAKVFQYQVESSTSDDSFTENIYEKPTQKFLLDSSRSSNTALQTNFILMSGSSCSNVASDITDRNTSTNDPHHYEQAHLSVPDLLQLQEIKDSDASDADDEASRDFDAPSSLSFYSQPTTDVKLSNQPSRDNLSTSNALPFYETISNHNIPVVVDALSDLSSNSEKPKNYTDDSKKVIHIRKLKVYTKGKKPEMPRMLPIPFNLEEADFSSPVTESFSENVAYASRIDIISKGESSDKSLSQKDSYAPDIISSIKEESESNFSKCSSSAPYYYSDLYSGYGLNFSDPLQINLSRADKISSKSSTSLLNNIRPKSPCTNKGDIGRKVNNISVEMREKSPSKYVNDDETKNNIKQSLGIHTASESKYLLSEKNKYEAGKTLEKTRTSSTMSYFKLRASTPDLNQSSEPVYENMFFQTKKLSQSLEEISAISKLLDQDENEVLKQQFSPVYENINFMYQIEGDTQTMQKSEYFQTNSSLQSFKDALNFPKDHSVDVYASSSKQDPSKFEEMLDNHFLDYNVSQMFNAKIVEGEATVDFSDVADFEKENKDHVGAKNTDLDSSLWKVLKQKTIDSDIVSDSTVSCDEASADSDNKHQALGRPSASGNSITSGLDKKTSKQLGNLSKLVQQSDGLMYKGKQLSLSAGDLLGKTHEELVLLLIQLRRNQSKILKTKERLESKIKREPQGMQKTVNSKKSECFEEQILTLEKQYEVTQPLVALVDNMIKLGSLYGSSHRRSFSLPTLDCTQGKDPPGSINYSQLLTEEKGTQNQTTNISTHFEDGLQKEANKMTTLHQDKELLEHTLFKMQHKILDHQDRPGELQKLRKQQKMIEKELVRVKRLLNTSAKKIEDATYKNDQMEQEILHLRHLLQQALKTGSTEMKCSQWNQVDLEEELTRLQSVLDELANHRHEISNTVEKLKSESYSSKSKGIEVRASPTGVAGSAPLPLRKKQHNMYLETDLDTMMTRDLALPYDRDLEDVPVYANAEEFTLSNEDVMFCEFDPLHGTSSCKQDSVDPELCSMQDINDADERVKRFYGILPKEKPSEIKTVRIVKRQSERRSRERDKKKVSYDEQSSVWIMEEEDPDFSSDDCLEAERNVVTKPEVQRPASLNLSASLSSAKPQTNSQSAHERLFGSRQPSASDKSVFQVKGPSMKRNKRRHYTVSGYQYMLDPQFSQHFMERLRSRDDVDMERCLRTANTPDIVRSTIKKKNEVFDDTLIDRELGLPQKIDIPERYVEVEPEHISATEKLRRSLKAENICKMLSETTTSYGDVVEKSPETLHKKLSEEKRKRAQLLSLNQALAREVVERSKAVAANLYPIENPSSF